MQLLFSLYYILKAPSATVVSEALDIIHKLEDQHRNKQEKQQKLEQLRKSIGKDIEEISSIRESLDKQERKLRDATKVQKMGEKPVKPPKTNKLASEPLNSVSMQVKCQDLHFSYTSFVDYLLSFQT